MNFIFEVFSKIYSKGKCGDKVEVTTGGKLVDRVNCGFKMLQKKTVLTSPWGKLK